MVVLLPGSRSGSVRRGPFRAEAPGVSRHQVGSGVRSPRDFAHSLGLPGWLATTHILGSLLLVGALLAPWGCATVPKEAVLLSHTVGEDIQSLHVSYASLVRTHFASLRREVNTFLDTRWTPAYLREFIQTGELVRLATRPDPTEVLEGVGVWAEVAVQEIADKRRELMGPLDRDEQALLASVDDAFARITRANAAVTAHLQSLRRIKEEEDETLQALHLKDLRDTINARLAETSDRTAKALTDLEKAAADVRGLKEKREELLNKAKGGGLHH